MEPQQDKASDNVPPAGIGVPSASTTGVETSPTSAPAILGSPSAGAKKNWLVPAMATIAVMAVVALVYLYSALLENRPTAIYSASLAKTGDALNALVSYSGTVAQKQYQSYSVNGDLHIAGTDSFDAVLSGTVGINGDSSLIAHASMFGEKLSANIKSVHVVGSSTPDVYIQPSGIKQGLNDLGLDSPDNLDGQWFVIDHTLVGSYLTSLNKGVSSIAKGATLPTAAQVQDAMRKAQAVNGQYIFTDNATESVLTHEAFVDEEAKDGRDTYRYQVGYNKAHLSAYIRALGMALDTSSLNTWSQTANGGKSLSQALDINSLEKTVANANPAYSFNVWVDTETKLIHAVQFVGSTGSPATFTISQDYTGGNVYPIGFDTSKGNQEMSLDLSIDTTTDRYVGELMSQGGDDDTTLDFSLQPSKKTVHVTAPAGAQSIAQALNELRVPNNGGVVQRNPSDANL